MEELDQSELQHWLDLRCLLWPGGSGDHLNEIQQYFCGQNPHIEGVWGVRSKGIPVMGFLELSLRSYAEGTSDSPVPYVEGWFVRADARGRGAGQAPRRPGSAPRAPPSAREARGRPWSPKA